MGRPSGRPKRGSRRVLIIVQNLPVPLDRRVWLECQTLVEGGYEVSVICPKGPGDPGYEFLDGVHIYKYSPPPTTQGALSFVFEFLYCWLRTAWLALRIYPRRRFRVIQSCNPPDTYFALAAPFKLLGTKFVFDQHDLCPEMFASRFGSGRSPYLVGLRFLERLTYATADHVVTTNQSYAEIAHTRGRKASDRVTVVLSGPDPNQMRPGPATPELRRGKTYLVCWLGIMGPQDGVDMALRAAHHYIRKLDRHDCHFAFLGFGDAFEDLQALAAELELDDYVEFTGRVGATEIASYLSTADLGLVPDPVTRYADLSTHNKTLEYMAYALPIVSTNLKETRRSADDAAVYVPSGDVESFALAIAELLDDPDRRDRMGSLGRKRIEDKLAWQHQSSNYLTVFEDLTA